MVKIGRKLVGTKFHEVVKFDRNFCCCKTCLIFSKFQAQDDVVKGKLLYYAKSVKNLSLDDEKKASHNKGSIIIFSSFDK